MSQGQKYFPPSGTKHRWMSKTLNYSPWTLSFWSHWPAAVSAYVDKKNGMYVWSVQIIDFDHKRHVVAGAAKTDLEACLAAEAECERQKSLLWKPWMVEAVAAGWRP